jgi:hypothetical protein|tara:strand:- start:16 stop:951 length:936 start_codon:yes stop_codon:yes gene_type:complete
MMLLRKIEERLRPGSVFWLLPGMLVLPIFTLASLFEEDNLPNAFQSVSTSAILWIPCLVLIAIISGKFRPIHTAYATVLFALYDSLRTREIIYDMVLKVIDLGGNPNWITLGAMVLPAVILFVVTIWRATLFRVVILVSALAQIATLTLFHTLTVIGPISVASETEKEFVEQYLEARGEIESLCGIQSRSCFSGSPDGLAEKFSASHLNPHSTVKLLQDRAGKGPALFTWTESAFAETADEAMRHITVHIDESDRALVMINEEAPTRSFGQMKIAFSILAGVFQQTWVTLSLLILWRHGDYTWIKGRWRRS